MVRRGAAKRSIGRSGVLLCGSGGKRARRRGLSRRGRGGWHGVPRETGDAASVGGDGGVAGLDGAGRGVEVGMIEGGRVVGDAAADAVELGLERGDAGSFDDEGLAEVGRGLGDVERGGLVPGGGSRRDPLAVAGLVRGVDDALGGVPVELGAAGAGHVRAALGAVDDDVALRAGARGVARPAQEGDGAVGVGARSVGGGGGGVGGELVGGEEAGGSSRELQLPEARLE
mmetsp:Transcript_19926/g.62691  ORF Transcript_19926/g.62691 Transcript_19926/m.62691 type:complete len:229 (-) Transcript_19926:375-1061(-)